MSVDTVGISYTICSKVVAQKSGAIGFVSSVTNSKYIIRSKVVDHKKAAQLVSFHHVTNSKYTIRQTHVSVSTYENRDFLLLMCPCIICTQNILHKRHYNSLGSSGWDSEELLKTLLLHQRKSLIWRPWPGIGILACFRQCGKVPDFGAWVVRHLRPSRQSLFRCGSTLKYTA